MISYLYSELVRYCRQLVCSSRVLMLLVPFSPSFPYYYSSFNTQRAVGWVDLNIYSELVRYRRQLVCSSRVLMLVVPFSPSLPYSSYNTPHAEGWVDYAFFSNLFEVPLGTIWGNTIFLVQKPRRATPLHVPIFNIFQGAKY